MREWLANVVVCARVQACKFVDLFVFGSEKDDGQIAALVESTQKFETVHPRHLNVEEGEIRWIGRQRSQGCHPIRIPLHLVTLLLKQHADGGEDVLVVVYECDGHHVESNAGS